MRPIRFLHCADLHIDSPFKKVADIDTGLHSILYNSTYESFKKIITLAIAEQVDFVLIAGDSFDSEHSSLRAQIKFRDELKRLAVAGIPAFIICGNHDPLNSWSTKLEWPLQVHRFSADEVGSRVVSRNGVDIAKIYGISFGRSDVRENLALKFPIAQRDLPCIGLLHTNIGNTGHDPYAPCSLADLESRGMDYWAVGHVHAFNQLRPANPAIVYPGCSQSTQPNENGPKGCCLVTINPDKAPIVQFIPTDSLRYAQDSLDITGFSSVDEFIRDVERKCLQLSEAADGRHCLIRLSLSGQTDLSSELMDKKTLEGLAEQIRDGLTGENPRIWLEKLIPDILPAFNLESLRNEQNFMGDVVTTCEELLNPGNLTLEELQNRLAALFNNRSGFRQISALSDEELRELLERARTQILTALLKAS